MGITTNMKLKQPDENEFYDVKVANDNMKAIDDAVGNIDAMKETVGATDLSDAIAKVFQLGNENKATLVSNLIAVGVQADTSETWVNLLGKILTITAGTPVEAVNEHLNCGDSYTIPEGYHDGTGVVSANSLNSQTSGTAVAANIVASKTAWVNGAKVTGTIPDKSGATVPASTASASGTNVLITIPASGFYNTLSKLSIPKSTLANYVS